MTIYRKIFPRVLVQEMQVSDCDCKTPLLDAPRTVRHPVDLRLSSEALVDHLPQMDGRLHDWCTVLPPRFQVLG
jgi:hypothetical protein